MTEAPKLFILYVSQIFICSKVQSCAGWHKVVSIFELIFLLSALLKVKLGAAAVHGWSHLIILYFLVLFPFMRLMASWSNTYVRQKINQKWVLCSKKDNYSSTWDPYSLNTTTAQVTLLEYLSLSQRSLKWSIWHEKGLNWPKVSMEKIFKNHLCLLFQPCLGLNLFFSHVNVIQSKQ